tara:strand:+ start:19 stop:444 length:426 start_codon:yes stop_codon:yes gene_type:complete
MKKITLKRPLEKFNQNCSYDILVGKHKLTDLKNGEEKIIELNSDLQNKNLKAKIQWCGSEKMELSKIPEDGIVNVSGNKLLNKRLPFLGAIIPLIGLTFTLNHQFIELKYLGVVILILLILGAIGVLTIWKNSWIKLERIE